MKFVKMMAFAALFFPMVIHANQAEVVNSVTVPFVNFSLHHNESVNAIYKLIPGKKLTCIVEPAAWYTAEWTYKGIKHKSDIRKTAITFSMNEEDHTHPVDAEGAIQLTSLFVWGTADNVGLARCVYH